MTAGTSPALPLPAHWTDEQCSEFLAARSAGNRELMVEMLLAADWTLEPKRGPEGGYLLPVTLEPPE
jgi:hypothetical protein